MGCQGSKDKEKPKNPREEDSFNSSGQAAPASEPEPELIERKLSNAEAELVSLEAMTNFDANEIECLRTKYNEIANIRTDDGIIYHDEFMETLLGPKKGKDPPILYQRLFQKFDMSNTGNIDFQDFVNGLSPFSAKAADEQKIKFSFGLMDVEENNVITRGEVRQLLLGAFKEANIQLTGDQVEELIDNTFEQAFESEEQKQAVLAQNKNALQQITYAQYERMCKQHPVMLKQFTLEELDHWLKQAKSEPM